MKSSQMPKYYLKEIKIIRWRKLPRYGYDCATQVSSDTAISIKKALEQFATYFRREFHYDFVQYHADGHVSDELQKAYIFPDPDGLPYWVGGCGFWYRNKNNKEYWALQWIWVHPQYRGRSIVRNAWEAFKEDIPSFVVEAPVSVTMQYLLLKMDFPEDLVEGGYTISLRSNGKC